MMKEEAPAIHALLEKLASNPTLRRAVLACVQIAAILVAPGASPIVLAIPVVLAAYLEGWIGALASALVSSLSVPGLAAFDMAALALVAAAASLTAGHERRLRRHFEEIAGRLSTVYEKVQANFEGMKRAERLSAIGQLSAGLAHEIRNPLASISGAAAILGRGQDLDARNARCIQIITSECHRLNGLLTNFLDFARPRPPRLQSVHIEPVLDAVLGLASHGVRGKSVRFEKRIAPGLPAVEGDPEQLEQVLLNLAINAVEASPDGEIVTLFAEADAGRISIGVIDHGHGVAPAHIDRLFDPFFTTKEHGTGLGLPVAHQIVGQMGGALLARANQGPGMTFSVILPAKA